MSIETDLSDDTEVVSGEQEILRVTSSDGVDVVLRCFAAVTPKSVLHMSSALGIRATYYTELARQLAAAGHTVYLHEQRGHGDSPVRPSWSCDYGYRHLVEIDLLAAVDFIRQRHRQLPVFVAGHSLGGQVALLFACLHPEKIDGLIVIGSAVPEARQYDGLLGTQLRAAPFVFGVIKNILGYYPGDRLGFGGREARTLMGDWAVAVSEGVWRFSGSRVNYMELMPGYNKGILNIQLQGDAYAPPKANVAMLAPLTNAKLVTNLISQSGLDGRQAHFVWAKNPTDVSASIIHWLQQEIS